MADFTKAIEIDPSDAESHLNRGVMRLNQHDSDGAIVDLSRAIEIAANPTYKSHDGATAETLALGYHLRGIAYGDKQDFTRALADQDKAISLNPTNADAYYHRGIARRNKGDYEGALADLEKVIKARPDFADAYYQQGIVRVYKGDLKGAKADFDRPFCWIQRIRMPFKIAVWCTTAAGDIEGAMADLDKALALAPNFALAYANRGLAHMRQGKDQAAETDFKKALELDSNLKGYIEMEAAEAKRARNINP